MELDTTLARVRALADGTLALLPGLLLGLLVLGLVLGRIGWGLTVVVGGFVAAAIATCDHRRAVIPNPMQQILLHGQTEVTDGDRTRQRDGWSARPNAENPSPRWQAMDGAHDTNRRKRGNGAMPDPEDERMAKAGAPAR